MTDFGPGPFQAAGNRDLCVCMCMLSHLVTSVPCCDAVFHTKEGASVPQHPT